jgi:amidase
VPDLSVAGPLARTVGDLQTALLAIAGPGLLDAVGWSLSLPPARPVRRLAAWFDDSYCPVDDEVKAALEEAADALTRSGVPVDRVSPRGIDLAVRDEVFRRALASVTAWMVGTEEIERIAAGTSAGDGSLGMEYVSQRFHEWAAAMDLRAHLRMRWQYFFQRYDAILLPVAPNLASRHDHRPFPERRIAVNGVERPYWDQIVWAGLTGVAHLPTTVVPVRRDSRGLPIGIAVAGPYLGDLTTIAVARVLTECLAPLGRPPWRDHAAS